MAADRHLLFGLLALQIGLIDQGQLVAAFQAWTRDKSRGLAEHLESRGALERDDRPAVEALVERHLRKYGDVEKSLAAVPTARSTRQRLAEVADADLSQTLSQAGSGSLPTDIDDESDRTVSYAVGSSTADGGRFHVLRPHARGGLGAVFVALDKELHREVALKQILDAHADDPTSRQRFLLEAEITGGLEHPGIVPVYGLGTYKGGRPFYAMRFIRGDSLKQAIERFHNNKSLPTNAGARSLELRQLLRRFTDVCNAIEYAHSRGVLHRDIKPSNIIVGKHGETLVIDWGLARARGRKEAVSESGEPTLLPSSASGSAETLPGQALGTPAYMSPEQARGELEALGPRSDVYSLGATLYCVLTGKSPFEGELHEVFRKVENGDFPRPRQIDATIDPALEAVCLKAMATRPADRYASGRALADDVERWMADEPVTAYPEPWTRTLSRWLARHRTGVTAAAAAGLAALVGLAAVLAVQRQSNAAMAAKNRDLDLANIGLREAIVQKDAANAALAEANSRVQARFELAREAIRSFKQGVEEEETLKEDRLRPLRHKLLGSARRFYDRLGELLRGQEDSASKAILAESYTELGELIDRIGQMSEAIEAFRKAVAIRRELAGRTGAGPSDRVALANALNDIGQRAVYLNDYAGALAAEEEAVSLVEPLASGPGATVEARRALALARRNSGITLAETGKNAEALVSLRQAILLQEGLTRDASAAPRDRQDLALSHSLVGSALDRTGDLAGALVAYRKCLTLMQALAAEHPEVPDYRHDLAISHDSVAGILERTGDLTGALAEAREYQGLIRALAAEHPAVTLYRGDLAFSHRRVGSLLEQTGDLAAALTEQRKSQDLMRAMAAEHPDEPEFRYHLAVSHNKVGLLLEQTGDLAEALAEHRQCQKLHKALAAEYPEVLNYRRELAVSHNRIGIVLERAGDLAGALAESREDLRLSLELADKNPNIPGYRRDLAITYNRIGNLLTLSGRPAEAVAELDRARGLLEPLTQSAPEVPDYRVMLTMALNFAGEALRDLGRLGEARDRHNRALALTEALVKSDPTVPLYSSRLADTLRRLALLELDDRDIARAVTQARRSVQLFEALPNRDGREWFWLACARTTLAAASRDASGRATSDAPKLADRAMADLREAVARGYRNRLVYHYEPALAPLRDREDFKLLMLDLAMPNDPFAK